MKDFLKFNFKYILLTLLGVIFVYLIVQAFSKNTGNSELLDFKLKELDGKIDGLNKKLDTYSDSIYQYKKEIQKLDSSINNIRIQKKVINNFFDEKAEDIKVMSAKEVDSTLRKRYKY
jgi:hypothetical protein